MLLPMSMSKLLAQWQGPYEVLRKVGKVNYEVLMAGRGKKKQIFHINIRTPSEKIEGAMISNLLY